MQRQDIIFRSSKVTNRMIRVNLINFFKRNDLIKNKSLKFNSSLVSMVGYSRFFHSSIVLSVDKNNLENTNTEVKDVVDNDVINIDNKSIEDSYIEVLESLHTPKNEIDNITVSNYSERYSQILREVQDEVIQAFLRENPKISSSFEEAFPDLVKRNYGLSTAVNVANSYLPDFFKESKILNELKNKYVEGTLFNPDHRDNLDFLKGICTNLMDRKEDIAKVKELQSLLDPENNEVPVKFDKGYILFNLRSSFNLAVRTFEFFKENKDLVLVKGLGSLISFLLWYKAVVKLQGKMIKITPEELKIPPAQRAMLMMDNRRHKSFGVLTGGVLAASVLTFLSQIIISDIQAKVMAARAKKEQTTLVKSGFLPFIRGKFNKIYLLILFTTILLVGGLQYFGNKNISDIISIPKLGLIFNLIILLFMTYNITIILIIINSPLNFEKSSIFKYLPRIFKNQYLRFNNITNQIIFKYYIRLFSSGIFFAIINLIAFNLLLLNFS